MNRSLLRSSSFKAGSLLLMFLITASTVAIAQLDQGIWLVGASGQFYRHKTKYDASSYTSEGRFTQIEISPTVGYFVSNKLAFGIKPTVSSYKGKILGPGGGTTNIQRYRLGPLARYYFLSAEQRVNIVADASYQYGWYRSGLHHGVLHTYSAFAGPVIFFNTSVALELLLGYQSSKEDVKDIYVDSRSGFQINVGFQIHLEN